jgi:hypothetical protein
MSVSNNELYELAKRMLNAFKHYECFIFEKREYKLVRRLLEETGLNKHVVLRRADPRYEYLYILLPWRIEFEDECVAYVKKLLAEGMISREQYKKNANILINQCIKHKEREKVREIINILENYIKK